MPGGQSTGGESRFAKGRRIDRYEIREPIGQGGMGAVYRAYDTKLGRMVALKTVVAHRRGGLNDELRQRFMREALAASKVDHRNVVRVLDFGFTEDGSPFIVMEYLRGRDLGARLKQNGGPLPVDFVVDVSLGVCAALRACHQAGIIHRDLKPANIFLADSDTGYEVKVLDFGVSKAPLAGDLTEDGQILGTPQYLSPEQVDGRTVPESDQYALGMLLYACLTNRLPYEQHQNISLLRAIELGRFDPPRAHRPDLPVGLEAVILKALSISPADRFASIHALGQKLWEFASPTGREQWRAYYFQAGMPAAPKESTVGVPLVEELARGTLKGPGPGPVLAPALAPTEALENAAPAVRPPTPLGAKPGSQAFVSTKLSRPEPAASGPANPASAEGSLIDVAGESAIRDAIGGGRTARRALVLLLGAAAVAGAAFLVRARSTQPIVQPGIPSPASPSAGSPANVPANPGFLPAQRATPEEHAPPPPAAAGAQPALPSEPTEQNTVAPHPVQKEARPSSVAASPRNDGAKRALSRPSKSRAGGRAAAHDAHSTDGHANRSEKTPENVPIMP